MEFNGKIPTELWAMIIDFIVVPLRHPYLYCKPETFPQYDDLLWNVNTSDKIPFMEDWKRIRAVCKGWKYLAGPNPWFFFKERPWADYPEIPQSTSIVFISSGVNEHLSMERIAHLKGNLTTLALGSHTYDTNALDILFENPSTFPNLQCLSVYSTQTIRPFWQVLQDEFPNLISLTVRSYSRGTSVVCVLKKLEILSICSFGGFRLVCPSLKHLHIRSSRWYTESLLLKEHSQQLQSFMGLISPTLSRETNILSSVFPNLVLSGCSMMSERGVPPPGHPLRHLRLFPNDNEWKPKDVMAEIDAVGLPELESVHINMNHLVHGTADDLRARCRKRGIRLVEIVDGIRAAVLPPQPKKAFIKTEIRFRTLPRR
ncbi:hypothetical protein FRC18_009923 [Serendipita sp. 400]|nr:hypothetical protein FRC18_009923 [Serendipita sp. 400]